jgi:hypothetical protein
MLGRKQSVEGAAFARGFFKRRDLRSRTGHRAPTTKVGRDGGAAAPYLLPTLNTGGKAGTIPSMGPIAIFDKSALQALNMDEAVWFDAFFSANVTPPLYVETLADLEKEVDAGKARESISECSPRRRRPTGIRTCTTLLDVENERSALPGLFDMELAGLEPATSWVRFG